MIILIITGFLFGFFEEDDFALHIELLAGDNCKLSPDDNCDVSFLLETASSDDDDCVVVDAVDVLLLSSRSSR